MLFAIDIDATIATDRNGYAKYLNDVLALGIEESVIEQLQSYDDFHALQVVQNYLRQSEQHDRYWNIVKSLQHEPEIQKQLIPISGAVQALHEMAQLGKIMYVTCRHSNAQILTQEWLASYNFPSPEQVATCAHYYDKYLFAYAQTRPREKIVLIDDHAEEMIEAFFVMAKSHMDIAISLKKRLAIIAFDCTEPPVFHVKIPFPVMALHSWNPDDMALMHEQQIQRQVS